MFRIRIIATLAALATAGLTVLGAAPAWAGLNTSQVQTVSDGSLGYSVTHSEAYSNAGATLAPTALALNIGNLNGGVFTGGIGVQLCDPNNGFGLQIGEVANPDGKTMAVKFAYGTLLGAAADSCVGNGVLPKPNGLHTTTLDAISPTDQVQVYTSFRNVKVRHCNKHGKRCHTTHQGRAKFQAQDLTSGFEIYSSGWIKTAADWNLTEAGFGAQQNTNGLSADTPLTAVAGPPAYDGTHGPAMTGAHSLLVSFSQAFVDGDGLGLPPCCGAPPIIATSTIHEVATSGNGLDSNPATAAPNGSGSFGAYSFSFSGYVGNVVS